MKKKAPYNVNNKNASKPPEERRDAYITMRVNNTVKERLQKESDASGYNSLSKWVLDKACQPDQQELIDALLLAVKWIPTVDELSSNQGALTQYDNVEQLIKERNRIDCVINKFNTKGDDE